MDAQSPKEMALTVLWGTFKTLEVSGQYIKFNFVDHPSVSSQYVKFLLTSKGQDKKRLQSAVMAEVTKVKEQCGQALQMAKDAKASAASASNCLDQLKKKQKT